MTDESIADRHNQCEFVQRQRPDGSYGPTPPLRATGRLRRRVEKACAHHWHIDLWVEQLTDDGACCRSKAWLLLQLRSGTVSESIADQLLRRKNELIEGWDQ